MGQRAIRSWISRHSYHSAGQIVKNKKLDHRVIKYLVWSKNSCGFARVVFQESPAPFTTLHGTCTCWVLADCREAQHVALALMMPLLMQIPHVLRERMTERRFPTQDQSRETLLFD